MNDDYDENLARDLRAPINSTRLIQLLHFRARMSQQTIATALGCSVRSVRHWSNGTRVPQPRFNGRIAFLAFIVAKLATTRTPKEINEWLTSPDKHMAGDRPIDRIAINHQRDFVYGLVELLVREGQIAYDS